MRLTLYTSGSTKEPKKITHNDILVYARRSIAEIGLSKHDRVLDVFPSNVIAHYTITSVPALLSGAHLVSMLFDPYKYIEVFKEYQPTYISLIPRHYEILTKTKGWEDLDMSCVRYMVTGSSRISQGMIDAFRDRGVQIVANWYGMTEMPPPVFVGYNTSSFDFTAKEGYTVDFTDEGECIINGFYTGDIFDLEHRVFVKRKIASDGNTWKT
jgi:long-subunit acyl-CoA synthetase (AMP-forming)